MLGLRCKDIENLLSLVGTTSSVIPFTAVNKYDAQMRRAITSDERVSRRLDNGIDRYLRMSRRFMAKPPLYFGERFPEAGGRGAANISCESAEHPQSQRAPLRRPEVQAANGLKSRSGYLADSQPGPPKCH